MKAVRTGLLGLRFGAGLAVQRILNTENEKYAAKLEEMFGNSPVECFEEFISNPGLAEALFESLEWYAVQDSEDSSDWDYGSFYYDVAYNMANECKKNTGFARIVTIEDGDDPVAVKEEVI